MNHLRVMFKMKKCHSAPKQQGIGAGILDSDFLNCHIKENMEVLVQPWVQPSYPTFSFANLYFIIKSFSFFATMEKVFNVLFKSIQTSGTNMYHH